MAGIRDSVLQIAQTGLLVLLLVNLLSCSQHSCHALNKSLQIRREDYIQSLGTSGPSGYSDFLPLLFLVPKLCSLHPLAKAPLYAIMVLLLSPASGHSFFTHLSEVLSRLSLCSRFLLCSSNHHSGPPVVHRTPRGSLCVSLYYCFTQHLCSKSPVPCR